MDDGTRISWLIVIILIFGAMYFAFAETALASVPRARIKAAADRGDRRAKRAQYVIDNFNRAITTILICTNITHLAAASIVTVTVTRIWGLSAVSISTIITTVAIFFFGEMLPKSIARKYSERFSLWTAAPLCFFMSVFRPASAGLTWIGEHASRLVHEDREPSVTENELYDIIDDMADEGMLEPEQSDLISSALQFGEVTAESILTSRMDIAAIDVDMPQEEILRFIKEQNHSRLPVYEGSIDNIIGILQIRKYIKAYLKARHRLNIRLLLDRPFFVHQSTKIDDLLSEMSHKKLNIAVVTDNYGGTLGIVTVEDILEELVGDIWDEDDDVEQSIVRVSDTVYSVSADEQVMDVLDAMDVGYSSEEEERITNKLMSELAYENFDNIPQAGDSFEYLNTRITVTRMNQNRIMRLQVEIADPEGRDGEEGSAE